MPKDFMKKVGIKMAIDWMKLAWADVKPATIMNCFGHCNIKATTIASDATVDEDMRVLKDMASDAVEVSALVELLGGDPNEVILDEDVAAFKSDPLDWEDDILIPVPVQMAAEETDDDGEDDEAPPPSIIEAAAALNVLAEWNRRLDIGAYASIAELADAIARARAPNGTLDSWLI